ATGSGDEDGDDAAPPNSCSQATSTAPASSGITTAISSTWATSAPNSGPPTAWASSASSITAKYTANSATTVTTVNTASAGRLPRQAGSLSPIAARRGGPTYRVRSTDANTVTPTATATHRPSSSHSRMRPAGSPATISWTCSGVGCTPEAAIV